MPLDHVLSFQLYSSRSFPPVEEQLRQLAALGFTNVEPYGDLYADAEGFRGLLDENGLAAFSGHFDLSMLENDLPTAVEIATVLGITLIVAPWLEPEDRPTDAAGWKTLGVKLATISDALASHSLKLAWHNHDFEFEALPDGSMPIAHLLDGNDVALELDIAWVVRAGVDPLHWIERYADRLMAVHVKDIAPAGQNLDQDGWTNVGTGVIDWETLWTLLPRTNARVAVLEHDEPKDWIDFARISAAAVNRLAGIA